MTNTHPTSSSSPPGDVTNLTHPQGSKSTARKSSPLLGVLPFIGVILFVVNAVPILAGDRTGDWKRDLVQIAVIYMIGWAGVGAGISHLLFSRGISRSIGWEQSPFELEVGFANLGYGVAGLLAGSYAPSFWLALIIATSIFRAGCGLGHIRQMITNRNFAVNNTAVLFVNFVVPAFLLLSYYAWAQ